MTGASVGHDRESASGEKDVKGDKTEVLGDGGLVGGPSNAVVAGTALLLYLDNANPSAVAAEAAVLTGPTVTRRRVKTCCRVSAATLLLRSTHLHRETVKGKTVLTADVE